MRAKTHDQRKGQWLINKIRQSEKYHDSYKDAWDHGKEKQFIEMLIFNIENKEFDEFMSDYDD